MAGGVGRYKLNKKLELADRLIGHVLARPLYGDIVENTNTVRTVIDPETGEISWLDMSDGGIDSGRKPAWRRGGRR